MTSQADREVARRLEHAIRWLSDRRRERPGAKPYELVEEAARQFDLSPRDEEFLLDFARAGGQVEPAAQGPREER
jgi:hypothetical protein